MHETVPKYNCLILIRAICQMSSSLRSNPLYGFTRTHFLRFAFCTQELARLSHIKVLSARLSVLRLFFFSGSCSWSNVTGL